MLLMDSSLEGQYANDDATKLVELASKCLQSEARDRPDTNFLLTAVAPLQKQKEVKKFIIYALEITFYIIFLPTLNMVFCNSPIVPNMLWFVVFRWHLMF